MKFENPSENLRNATKSVIMADLVPSRGIVHLKILTALLVGGGFSLLVCAQFGTALSPVAALVYSSIHENLGKVACGLISVLVYMGFSLSTLRFICSAIQYRVILNKHWLKISAWTLIVAAALSIHSDHKEDISMVAAWACAALIALIIFRKLNISIFTKKLIASDLNI